MMMRERMGKVEKTLDKKIKLKKSQRRSLLFHL
jgi:hypothetical protein